MSYILDALKKSEKERRRGEVPGVLSQQDAPYPVRRRRILWPYLILGPLVINIIVLLWVFNPWQQKTPARPPGQTAAAPEPSPQETGKTEAKPAGVPEGHADKSAKRSPDAPAGKGRTQERERAKGQARPEAPAKRPAESDARQVDGPPSNQLQETRPAHRDEAVAKAVEDLQPPAANKIYGMAELPLSVKQKLPALSLSLTVFSEERTSRLATVNGQTVREGQTLSGGVKVEEILPDSVVFVYQGYRFSVHMR